MTCAQCGNPNAANGGFCSNCGIRQPAQPAASMPYPPYGYVPRVQRHLQTLSTLWIIFGIYRAVTAVIGLFFAGLFLNGRFMHRFGMMGDPMRGIPWMHALIPFAFGMTLIMSAAAVIVGYGLMQRYAWARVAAIVFGVLALLKFPLGTALGIYTLWVLAPSASGAEYDAIAQP